MNIVKQHNPYGAAHNEPKMIVVHCMGEYVKDVDGAFIFAPRLLENMGFSAHAMVAPDGTIYRCREDNEGANHARDFNPDSLGIEVLVAGQQSYATFPKAIKTDYVTAPQWDAAVWQVREWVKLYGITKIVRHSDVSPGRKIDPGAGFAWGKFLAAVRKGDRT